MTHIRFAPKSLAIALLAGVAAMGAGVTPVLADPPDWAPAHGWRAKQERHHDRHDRERHERGRHHEHGYIDGGYGDGRVVIVRRPPPVVVYEEPPVVHYAPAPVYIEEPPPVIVQQRTTR
ncbi:hypothetical protein GBZ26_27755, partial [Azospirillum formosense]|nr:hypothetical protein [Azospirillum formosense]